MSNLLQHFPGGGRTVKPRDRASAEAKGVCARYAEPCSLGDNSVSRQRWRMPAMEGQSDCPNKSAVVDEIVARLKAKKEG